MRDKVLEVLEGEFPEIDFLSSDELVDDGILDSLTLTGIVAALTMEFGITIPYEEIIEEKGLNASQIVRELAKDIQGGGGGQPFFATAGGKNADGVRKALARAADFLPEK